MSERPFRSGIVALLGFPNAGKSTLMNTWLGERLAIVTPKPQTTRSRILGVLNREDAQVLLTDTPGVHRGKGALSEAMNEAAAEAAADCDLALLLVDRTKGWKPLHDFLLTEAKVRGTIVFLVGTKQDRREVRDHPWPPPGAAAADAVFSISAKRGEGVDELLDAIIARLPVGPPFFPDDQLTDRSLRFLVAEFIREACYRELEQELPYAAAAEVEAFDESTPELTRIRATIFVMRESQKRMAIGKGGSMIKRIGSGARRQIEQLLGTKVFLDLRVKVDPTWAKKKKRIEKLGYH
jgi:GTP-binding protein Era